MIIRWLRACRRWLLTRWRRIVGEQGKESVPYALLELHGVHRFPPVGQCIYCGAQEGLTDEHIVPLALNGTMILPKSSCADCNKLTSEIERQVLRGFMHDARLAGAFKSRKAKKQPKNVRVRLIDEDNNVTEVDVPRFDAPGLMILPTFSLPSFLLNGPPVNGITIVGAQLLNVGGQQDMKAFTEAHGAAGFQAQATLEIEPLAQMLAKIAYAFSVAITQVIGRESSPVPNLLRDKTNTGRWVGSEIYQLESEGIPGATHALAHQVQDTSHGPADVVRIKLFAGSGLVEGYIVVARAPNWLDYESTAT